MVRTNLFLTNRSQAVRLSAEVALPHPMRDVVVPRDGARRVVAPADALWDDLFDGPGTDLPRRKQPPPQEREHF